MKINLHDNGKLVFSYESTNIPQKHEYITVDGSQEVYKILSPPLHLISQAGRIAMQFTVNLTVRKLSTNELREIFGWTVVNT